MGSGKTTLGRHIHKYLDQRGIQATHLDIDDMARRYSPPLAGDAAYHIYRRACECVLKKRIPLVATATLRDRVSRDSFIRLYSQYGYNVTGVFLMLPIGEATQRALHRTDDHLLKANHIEENMQNWTLRFDAQCHDDLRRPPWMIIEGIVSRDALLERVVSQISELQSLHREGVYGMRTKEAV